MYCFETFNVYNNDYEYNFHTCRSDPCNREKGTGEKGTATANTTETEPPEEGVYEPVGYYHPKQKHRVVTTPPSSLPPSCELEPTPVSSPIESSSVMSEKEDIVTDTVNKPPSETREVEDTAIEKPTVTSSGLIQPRIMMTMHHPKRHPVIKQSGRKIKPLS